MTINGDQSAVFDAGLYNRISPNEKDMSGIYRTNVRDAEFKEIIDLLNYLDVEKLKGHYAVNWTCDQSGNLKITYDNGKSKYISDYGMMGTPGLMKLHQLLFDLRKNQQWTLIRDPYNE